MPPKPEVLQEYEVWKRTGLPYASGGYLDQPHLILILNHVIGTTVDSMEALAPDSKE